VKGKEGLAQATLETLFWQWNGFLRFFKKNETFNIERSNVFLGLTVSRFRTRNCINDL